MARKISTLAVKAFVNRRKFASGNTVCDGDSMYLHNNKIAQWVDDAIQIYPIHGYREECASKTTKERLNALASEIDSSYRLSNVSFNTHLYNWREDKAYLLQPDVRYWLTGPDHGKAVN